MRKPNIFICGPTGSGKSTSLRNLNPERTIILNCERKQLPFRGAVKFQRQLQLSRYKLTREQSTNDKDNTLLKETFHHWLGVALKMQDADVIVIESFTSLIEQIFQYCQSVWKGYDLWREYANEVFKVLDQSKNTEKYVVFLGLDSITQDENNAMYRMIKVEGNKMAGGNIEKEFVMVLHTLIGKNEDSKPTFNFLTNSDGERHAKSPMDMLPYHMNNDLSEVIALSDAYYEGEEQPDESK